MKTYSRKQKSVDPYSQGPKKKKKSNKATEPSHKEKDIILKRKNVPGRKLFSDDWDIDYRTSAQVLSSLLEPHELAHFIEEYWEKQPLIIERSKHPAVVSCFSKFFSKNILFEILQKHSLHFVQDINACCYTNGRRKTMNGKGKISVKKASNLLEKEGGTLQIHQPQRFVPSLWKLLEKLECYFGCLVGSNVYITPSGSQGLPPHYDDVEVFILQLEGEKEWKLYKPPVILPRTYSQDLLQEEIGDPTHQFTLQPGDLLYMPRGTVHQARTPKTSCSHSTHITISTYQKHAVGDYLLSIFPVLLEKAIETSHRYRQGLPIGFLSDFQINQSIVDDALQELPDIARKFKLPVPYSILRDFMQSRLPPFGIDRCSILESAPSGKPPNLQSTIYLTYPEHTAWAVSELEDDNNSIHSYLLVYTSLTNNSSIHMMTCNTDNEDSNVLKFPVHYKEAMEQLKNCYPHPFCISNLNISDDNEKIQFVTSLWSQHLLTVDENKL